MGDTPKTRAHKTGLPPGTPVHIGERRVEKVLLKIHEFSEHHHKYFQVPDAVNIRKPSDEHQKIWINVQGLQQVETLQALADVFEWHPLVLEDLVQYLSATEIRRLRELCVHCVKAITGQ